MMKQTDVIFLIGFSGSGKSTVGPQLARLLKAKFYDTDDLIEQESGLPVAEMFAKKGEVSFRKAETAMITRLVDNSAQYKVISLGGGAFQSASNRKLIDQNGLTVYLSCSVRQLYRRLKDKTDRPLLNVKSKPGQTRREAVLDRIATMLKGRVDNYNKADLIVSTSRRSIEEVTASIVAGVQKFREEN